MNETVMNLPPSGPDALADLARSAILRAIGRLITFAAFVWLARALLADTSVPFALLAAVAGGGVLLFAFRAKAPSTFSEWITFSAGVAITACVALPASSRGTLVHSWLVVVMAAPIAVHVCWGAVRGIRAARQETDGRAKIRRALEEVVPAGLAKVAAAELTIIGHAFRWTGPADVPEGALGFAYHRLVSPMMWAFLCLALIEITVVHLLVSIWSATAAWILFIVSDVSLLYLLGLISSLRRLPVLIDHDNVRIRAGILYDFSIPLSSIVSISAAVASDDLRKSGTLKTSLLAYPNVLIEVSPALPSPKPFGKGGEVSRVALALDDRFSFIEALRATAARVR